MAAQDGVVLAAILREVQFPAGQVTGHIKRLVVVDDLTHDPRRGCLELTAQLPALLHRLDWRQVMKLLEALLDYAPEFIGRLDSKHWRQITLGSLAFSIWTARG